MYITLVEVSGRLSQTPVCLSTTHEFLFRPIKETMFMESQSGVVPESWTYGVELATPFLPCGEYLIGIFRVKRLKLVNFCQLS